MSETEFTIKQIGKVVKDVTGNHLEIFEPYREALLELNNYSHLHVYWWAHEFDNHEQRSVLVTDIPYAKEGTQAGVFACRSPERPNLIMESICDIRGISRKNGRIYIEMIDANHDTPIIDIKPYIHCVDRVEKKVRVPKWLPAEWGQWRPKGGIPC